MLWNDYVKWAAKFTSGVALAFILVLAAFGKADVVVCLAIGCLAFFCFLLMLALRLIDGPAKRSPQEPL